MSSNSQYEAGKPMKAWSQSVHGKAPELLKVVEVPSPAAGERDIVVHVRGVATNPVDAKVRVPKAPAKDGDAVVGDPPVGGWDAAGVVVATGAGARRFQVGDEVFFAGDVRRPGCFAEYVAVDERAAAFKPRSLSFTEAAAVPLTALTAYEGLLEAARVKESECHKLSLLVISGAGGVGSILTQLAKRALGFGRVVATASRPETVQFCLDHGADATINHREDLAAQLEGAGAAGGFDVVFNCSEADGNYDSLAGLLRPRGRLVLITGMHRDVNITPFMFKRCSVHFEFMFSRLMFDDEPERQAETLARFATWIDDGVLSARVRPENRLTIADLPEATRRQLAGRTIGKLVLDCAEWPAVSSE